jgi:hypothetical protein
MGSQRALVRRLPAIIEQPDQREMTDDRSLVIGLSSWIIQDGNYGDFCRGDAPAFALEFYAATPLEEFEPERTSVPSLIHNGGACYELVGQVVHVADDWWAIDAGILVFRDGQPPPNVRRGGWLRGRAYIGIDPFFYFERLANQPGAPALIYDWKIVDIEMQTAPFVETKPGVLERDPARLGWSEIAKTDAWRDDGGQADYLLHCKRLDSPARRTLNPPAS